MGRSFCGVPSKHTQDWAVNNHMLQTGLSFAEYFCHKTPKKFSKICQNRSSEKKETINFKNFRGAAPNPAGELTAPPRPPAGFLVGIHIKITPVTPLSRVLFSISLSQVTGRLSPQSCWSTEAGVIFLRNRLLVVHFSLLSRVVQTTSTVMALDHSAAEPSFVVQRIYFFYHHDDF